MEYPERREVGGRVPLGSNGPSDRRGSPDEDPTSEGPTTEIPAGDAADEDAEVRGEHEDSDEFQRRLEEKDRHIEELYDEIAAARVAADGAAARAEAGELRVRDLEEDRARLQERIRGFEEEERRRRRRREGQDRRVGRLEREIERREAALQRLQEQLGEKDREIETRAREARALAHRRESALQNALRRVEALRQDLEERGEELRTGTAEILRTGLNLFNSSEYLAEIGSISRSLGEPEVRVALEEGSDEPPVVLTFLWSDATRRTYAANPGLAEEPRVRRLGDAEISSHEPPNAHLGPDGRVVMGL